MPLTKLNLANHLLTLIKVFLATPAAGLLGWQRWSVSWPVTLVQTEVSQ